MDKSKVVPVHTIKTYRGSVGVDPLIFNLFTRCWLAVNQTLVRSAPRKEPRYALNGSFGGPQRRYGRCGEKKKFLPPSLLEHRSYSLHASRYTFYATQASHSVPKSLFA